ncbi:hypothetical protein SCHPADRAFT_943156 [Schizopora paradoxa]|uniref:Uncharacterized protein n=1 Tax=Schizopora paradoxa TaxID=27342 RepID=A0A0H2RDY8_9AGAM|nr:hypothetical protein SCHPADRAFT_943156 [Schizopora paradoxa]
MPSNFKVYVLSIGLCLVPSTALSRENDQRLPVVLTHMSPYHETCIASIFKIVKLFDRVNNKERAQRWFDVLLHFEDHYRGGRKAVFKTFYGALLTTMDLWEYYL